MDWTEIKDEGDREPFFAQRSSFPANLIKDDVIIKQRSAPVIYGAST